jgi:hypothetical protein
MSPYKDSSINIMINKTAREYANLKHNAVKCIYNSEDQMTD